MRLPPRTATRRGARGVDGEAMAVSPAVGVDLAIPTKITETTGSRYRQYLLLSRHGRGGHSGAGRARRPLGAAPRATAGRSRRRDDPGHPHARCRRGHGPHRCGGRAVQEGDLPPLRRQGRPLPGCRRPHRRTGRRQRRGRARAFHHAARGHPGARRLDRRGLPRARRVRHRGLPLRRQPSARGPAAAGRSRRRHRRTGHRPAHRPAPRGAAVTDDRPLSRPHVGHRPRRFGAGGRRRLAGNPRAGAGASCRCRRVADRTRLARARTGPRRQHPHPHHHHPDLMRSGPEGTEMSTAAGTPTPNAPSIEAHEHLEPIGPSAASGGSGLAGALRRHLDGPFGQVRDHGRALDPAALGPPPQPLPMDEHRARVTSQLAELATQPYAGYGFPEHQGGAARYGEAVAAFEMLGHADLSLFVKAGVQWGLFGGAVSLLGTSRHDELVPRIISGQLQGCFAMTETGHGSDVQSLLTTATLDRATDELVVHSPGLAARKDYIGNAARDAHVAAVFAQLVVDGESRGVHCVLVPVREDDGSPARGVTIEDCGPKAGLDGVDNGRLTFDHVRIPRTNLLGRYGDIGDDGTYSSPIENPGRRFFTMLGTLVRGRISVAGGAGAAARSALAVTTAYAVSRRQFAAPGTDVETTVLDYRTYQRRLLPRIATAYALQLSQHELVAAMDDVLAGRAASEEDQRRLETRAAGVKVLTTRHATDTIQECRELCGGAGYLRANRLAALKADTDIFTTFEGDNTVLLQLVAKSLLADYQATFGDLDTAGIVRFGARLVGGTVIERASARGFLQRLVDAAPGREEDVVFGIRGTQLRLLREREEHLLEGLARRLRRATAPGVDAFAVFNGTQDHLVDAATAHVERVVAETFAASVDSCPDEEARTLLARVCDLHVLSTIERHKAWYLEHDRLSPARSKALTALVNAICAELRPHAQTLVNAFGVPEGLLATEMSGTA